MPFKEDCESGYFPFIRHATNPNDTWVAFTESDRYGQRQVHIISAPTARLARAVLKHHEGENAAKYKIKGIADAISDLVRLFEEGYTPRSHQLSFSKH